MFTVAYVFRRPDAMTLEEFHYHYEHVHGPIAARLPGLVSYIQHPIRKDTPSLWHVESDHGFDAISVYTFESDTAAELAFNSDVNKELQIDSHKLINFEGMLCFSLNARAVKLAEKQVFSL